MRWKRIFLWMDQWSKTTSHEKTEFEYKVTRRTSYRSWFQACHRILHPTFPSSTSMTPLRQERDHPTSSSSSSTWPTMTSSTVSSDSVDRLVRRDLCGIDSSPAAVSSERVERQERWDPYSSETSEELLNKPTKIKKEDHEQVRWDPYYSDIQERLQDLRGILVDDEVPEHRE